MLKKYKLILVLFISSIIAISCGSDNGGFDDDVVSANFSTVTTDLYFNSTIKPIAITTITSPVEGAVIKTNFQYGQVVQQGDILLIVESISLANEIRSVRTTFLQAEQEFKKVENWITDPEVITAQQNLDRAKRRYEETKRLAELGFVSRNSLEDDRITYESAERSLQQTMEKGSDLNLELARIKLEQAKETLVDLQNRHDNLIVKAPATGIVLEPERSISGNTSAEKISVGSQVKQGAALLIIGDFSGITLEVNINEIDIHKVKTGLPVTITGNAFPGVELQGTIQSVGVQARSEFSGIPNFPITIKVPQLSTQQAEKIYVGMSATIHISIEEEATLMVPINAITRVKNKTFLTIINPQTGAEELVEVETGHTTLDRVAIISGIQPGDNIVIPD